MNNMAKTLDKMAQEQAEMFNALDKAEMINIARNYSVEERTEICKTIQTDILIAEIERRQSKVNTIIDNVLFVLKNYEELGDMNLSAKEDFIKEMREAVMCNDGD